jgi:hypothetical protein
MNTLYLAFFLVFLAFYLVLFLVLVFSHRFDQRRRKQSKPDPEYKDEPFQFHADVNTR